MTNEQIKISAAAKNYAEALIEIAQSGKLSYDALAADLEVVNGAFSSSEDLTLAIENPAIDIKVKNDIIDGVFGGKVSVEIINFLKILVDKKRISEFSQIYAEFKNKYYFVQNIQPVTIISAIALNNDQKKQITDKLAAKLNKKIITAWETDADIIAGITVKINDNVLDMSLKNRLEKLSKSLMLK
ncbi:ATP synthase F1 subunit delta [bacterium]|nr:ATP synthase F1 subunit delta [bacterium]